MDYPSNVEINLYARELNATVLNRCFIKLLFATVFLLLALVSMYFTYIAFKHHSDMLWYWMIIAVVTIIMGSAVSKIPSNRRTLIAPTNVPNEINIADYFWLEGISQQFPIINDEIKIILKYNDKVTFADFEKIWIRLGEYENINSLEKTIEEAMIKNKSFSFIEANKIKQRILAS